MTKCIPALMILLLSVCVNAQWVGIELELDNPVIERSSKDIAAKIRIKNVSELSLYSGSVGDVEIGFSRCATDNKERLECVDATSRFVSTLSIPKKQIKPGKTLDLTIDLTDLKWRSASDSAGTDTLGILALPADLIYLTASTKRLLGYQRISVAILDSNDNKIGEKQIRRPKYEVAVSNVITAVIK